MVSSILTAKLGRQVTETDLPIRHQIARDLPVLPDQDIPRIDPLLFRRRPVIVTIGGTSSPVHPAVVAPAPRNSQQSRLRLPPDRPAHEPQPPQPGPKVHHDPMHPVTGRREDARTRGHAHAAPVIVHHDDLARAPQRGGQPVRMPAPHGRPRLQVQEQDIAPPVDGEPAPRVEGRV
ncbi:hypothetical protein PG991_009492 [Apiospora marii]|uniref:Uncharacterized protein n=1 Tax=Apiospora marii TaxID=335849 RepID=A0ABR1RK39_9PEZI